MIVSIFTPHGGCPERCNFCDQSVSGGTPVSVRKITETIDKHLVTNPKAEAVAFYGGTFTAMPKDRQLGYLKAVKPYLDDGRVGEIRVATRPDAIDFEWMQTLTRDYGVKTVELGVQSFETNVLRALGRSHSVESIDHAVEVLRKLGIRIGLHLMIGCPSESAHHDETLLQNVLRLYPDMVRIHPLLVLRDTAIAAAVKTGEFSPLSLEQAVERAAYLLGSFDLAGIEVIRMGLQPNELLGEAIVAGPYHPAFGDLVRGRLHRNSLEKRLSELRLEPRAAIEFELSERIAGTLKGKSRENLEWLTQRFNLSKIEVRVVKEPPHEQIKIRLCHATGAPKRWQVQPTQ